MSTAKGEIADIFIIAVSHVTGDFVNVPILKVSFEAPYGISQSRVLAEKAVFTIFFRQKRQGFEPIQIR